VRFLCTLLLVLAAGISSLPAATPAGVAVGEQLPNAPMQGLTGRSEFLSEYLGKPLIINVWASHCGPCLAEMGSLERFYRRFGTRFNLIGISTDDYRERAEAFLAKADTTFPHYIDRQLMLENLLGASTIPLTLLVDADGRVLKKVYGAQEWDSPEIVETIGQIYQMDL
jgi:thiol-disulfide isomerase/thioredoxin